MLKYLDNSFCDNNIIDSELFIGLTINEFNIIYNKIQYTMSESNIIQRTMYLGKIDSNGNIIDVIDLYSNTNDNSPYTLFTDTNVTICRDSELVIVDDNNSVVKIGFISSLMFENKYIYEIYRGFIYSFNNYQQIVYIKYIYILFYQNSNPKKRILIITPPIGKLVDQIEYLTANHISIVIYFIYTDMYDYIRNCID